MTRKAQYLGPGDHIDGESSPVEQTFTSIQSPAMVYVLMQGGNWRRYSYGREVELKPRTVAAKDACRLKVRHDGKVLYVKVVGIVEEADALLAGNWVDDNSGGWILRGIDEQLEVVDNA